MVSIGGSHRSLFPPQRGQFKNAGGGPGANASGSKGNPPPPSTKAVDTPAVLIKTEKSNLAANLRTGDPVMRIAGPGQILGRLIRAYPVNADTHFM